MINTPQLTAPKSALTDEQILDTGMFTVRETRGVDTYEFAECDLFSFARAIADAAVAAHVAQQVPDATLISKAMWNMFEYGKKDYNSCAKEELADLLLAIAPQGASHE